MDIEVIKGNILAVIDRHTNLTKVNEELHVDAMDDKLPGKLSYSPALMRGTYIKDYILLYAQLTGTSVKQSFENVFVSELHLITTDSFFVCLGEEQMAYISTLIGEITAYSSIAEMSVKINANVKYFQHCLPINVVFELNKRSLLKLPEFIQLNISKQQVLKELVCAIEMCCLSDNEEHLRQVSDLLIILIKCGYCEESADKAMVKICQYILQYVIHHVLTKLSDAKKKTSQNGDNVFKFIRSSESCPDSVLASCYLHQLVMYVGNNPSYKVSDAVMQQSSWNSFALPPSYLEAFKQMLSSCGNFDQIASCLKKALSKPEINWKSLLSLTSSVLVLYTEAAMFFEEYITQAIKKGLEENSCNDLIVGLLLSRHCSSEGGHVFASYSTWFQKYFNAGTHNLLSSARAYRFLIKFLTSLMPYEPLQYVKVHVLKPPHPPNSNLRELLREYTTLALTRVDDLKQSMPGRETEPSLASEEVDEAVKMFAKTSKIPTNVMEISIFRKSYYLEKFLPVLLQPRPLPSVEDEKMKFIASLLRFGKIPKSIYSSYQAKCSEASARLLEGIVDLEDDFDDCQHCLERLNDAIRQLCSTATENDFENRKFKDFGLSISRILHQLLGDSSSSSSIVSDEPINLGVEKSLDELHVKIVDQIFESLGFSQFVNVFAIAYLMKVIENFCSIKEAICSRIWNHCTKEMKQTTFAANNGITLLVLVGHMQHIWLVTHPLLNEQKRLLRSEESEEKICSLLQAIMLMSPLTPSTFTSFVNEIKLNLDIIEKLKQLQGVQLVLQNQQSFQMVYDFLLYANVKVRHYLKEKHQNDFLRAKRPRLEDIGIDYCLFEEDKVIVSLQNALELVKENSEFLKKNDHSIINEFIRREIRTDPHEDFLTTVTRKRFYKAVLLQQNVPLETVENIVVSLLDVPLNTNMQEKLGT